MQVLGVSHTDIQVLTKRLQELTPGRSRLNWTINPQTIDSSSFIGIYTDIKLFGQELPTLNKIHGRSVFLCSSVMRQVEFRGITPLDWQPSVEPGVYVFKPLPCVQKLQRLIDHPIDNRVERAGRFVDILIGQLKGSGILQPILEQIHVLSLSAQKASREYVFRTLAGESVRQPASVPSSINQILDSPAGRQLAQVIRQITAKKLSYSRAVSEGTDDYELRYVIKGLITIGYTFSADINALFWEKAQTQCKAIKNHGLVK